MIPLIAIPARFASTRLPGKPLRELAGRHMIEHVVDRARAYTGARVVVATDDQRIADVVQRGGTECVLTRSDHATGSDRLAEVVNQLQLPDQQIVVNLQGDEPLMPLSCLKAVVHALAQDRGAALSTLAWPVESLDELFDPNCVKVVCDEHGRALYFSRAPIPWARDDLARDRSSLPTSITALRHVGLYAYRAAALKKLAALPATPLERAESLEQLRALGHGMAIAVERAPERIPAGVDTQADLRRVESELLRLDVRSPAVSAAVLGPRRSHAPRSLLFVCMGNICRSPVSLAYAQKLAAQRRYGARMQLASRGTHADHRGAPADLRSMMLARAKGLDLSAHRAAPLELGDFVNFDLILAHDERNMADLMRQCPLPLRHKLRYLMDFAPAAGRHDVPDPYPGDHDDFIRADELIQLGVSGLFAELDSLHARPSEPRQHRDE
jgi:3-deoxy-manno-octulosonate cytidylyltransferase (CMP-KDO synthetase)